MNAEQLNVVAGVVLSLAFSYIPGLSDWYGGLDGTKKRLVMLAALAAVALGSAALSCGNVVLVVVCDKAGLLALFYAFVQAVIANQATYLISPRVQRLITVQ
jgi:hypothetical protein